MRMRRRRVGQAVPPSPRQRPRHFSSILPIAALLCRSIHIRNFSADHFEGIFDRSGCERRIRLNRAGGFVIVYGATSGPAA